MSAVAVEQLEISLELGCNEAEPWCSTFAGPLWLQLTRGNYDLCSVMPVPGSVAAWREEHRTARKRADRAERLGYRFVRVRRHERTKDVYLINNSLGHRQGRPMSEGYRVFPSMTPDPDYPCRRHGIHPYGVEDDHGRLVAYLWLYRAGELGLVSQILGHGAFMEHGIMYLLWQGMLGAEIGEPGFIVYNRHDSGTDGLRFYKERVGLDETSVRWGI